MRTLDAVFRIGFLPTTLVVAVVALKREFVKFWREVREDMWRAGSWRF